MDQLPTTAVLLGAEPRPISRKQKVRLLSAFLALLGISAGLLLVFWIGARLWRRSLRSPEKPPPPPPADDWLPSEKSRRHTDE
jgi:hypothetical protein